MDIFSSLWALIREPFFKYSVAASLGYTIVEYIDEHLLDDTRSEKGNGVGLLTLVSGFFGIIISLLIFIFAACTGASSNLMIGHEQMIQVLFSGALEVLWMIPYLHATNRVGTMKAAPLFQVIPVFSFILGYFVFGEDLGSTHIAGSMVIVSGAFLLNLNQDTFRIDRVTVGLMFLASFIIALVYSIFKDATIESNLMATLFWSGLGMTLMSCLVWLIYKPYREEFNQFILSPSKKLVLLQLVNEGVNAASVTASHFAAVKAPSVMVATALNAFHPVFILVIGWIINRFGPSKNRRPITKTEGLKRVVSILMIMIGTIIIAL